MTLLNLHHYMDSMLENWGNGEIYVETYKTSRNLRKSYGKMFEFDWRRSCFTENMVENANSSVISEEIPLIGLKDEGILRRNLQNLE